MKEVAGATALMLDASGNVNLLEPTPTSLLAALSRSSLAFVQLCSQTPWPHLVLAGSIHSLFRENTVITGSYW